MLKCFTNFFKLIICCIAMSLSLETFGMRRLLQTIPRKTAWPFMAQRAAASKVPNRIDQFKRSKGAKDHSEAQLQDIKDQIRHNKEQLRFFLPMTAIGKIIAANGVGVPFGAWCGAIIGAPIGPIVCFWSHFLLGEDFHLPTATGMGMGFGFYGGMVVAGLGFTRHYALDYLDRREKLKEKLTQLEATKANLMQGNGTTSLTKIQEI